MSIVGPGTTGPLRVSVVPRQKLVQKLFGVWEARISAQTHTDELIFSAVSQLGAGARAFNWDDEDTRSQFCRFFRRIMYRFAGSCSTFLMYVAVVYLTWVKRKGLYVLQSSLQDAKIQFSVALYLAFSFLEGSVPDMDELIGLVLQDCVSEEEQGEQETYSATSFEAFRTQMEAQKRRFLNALDFNLVSMRDELNQGKVHRVEDTLENLYMYFNACDPKNLSSFGVHRAIEKAKETRRSLAMSRRNAQDAAVRPLDLSNLFTESESVSDSAERNSHDSPVRAAEVTANEIAAVSTEVVWDNRSLETREDREIHREIRGDRGNSEVPIRPHVIDLVTSDDDFLDTENEETLPAAKSGLVHHRKRKRAGAHLDSPSQSDRHLSFPSQSDRHLDHLNSPSQSGPNPNPNPNLEPRSKPKKPSGRPRGRPKGQPNKKKKTGVHPEPVPTLSNTPDPASCSSFQFPQGQKPPGRRRGRPPKPKTDSRNMHPCSQSASLFPPSAGSTARGRASASFLKEDEEDGGGQNLLFTNPSPPQEVPLNPFLDIVGIERGGCSVPFVDEYPSLLVESPYSGIMEGGTASPVISLGSPLISDDFFRLEDSHVNGEDISALNGEDILAVNGEGDFVEMGTSDARGLCTTPRPVLTNSPVANRTVQQAPVQKLSANRPSFLTSSGEKENFLFG